jgi:hypothetical protein
LRRGAIWPRRLRVARIADSSSVGIANRTRLHGGSGGSRRLRCIVACPQLAPRPEPALGLQFSMMTRPRRRTACRPTTPTASTVCTTSAWSRPPRSTCQRSKPRWNGEARITQRGRPSLAAPTHAADYRPVSDARTPPRVMRLERGRRLLGGSAWGHPRDTGRCWVPRSGCYRPQALRDAHGVSPGQNSISHRLARLVARQAACHPVPGSGRSLQPRCRCRV